MLKVSIRITGYRAKIWDGTTGLDNPIGTLFKGIGPRGKAGKVPHIFLTQLFIHTNLINAEAISELYQKLVTATLYNNLKSINHKFSLCWDHRDGGAYL